MDVEDKNTLVMRMVTAVISQKAHVAKANSGFLSFEWPDILLQQHNNCNDNDEDVNDDDGNDDDKDDDNYTDTFVSALRVLSSFREYSHFVSCS